MVNSTAGQPGNEFTQTKREESEGGTWWVWATIGGTGVAVVLLYIWSQTQTRKAPIPARPWGTYTPPPAPAPTPAPSLPTVLVRVITPPAGEAPDWVRLAWVGVVLPAVEKRVAPGQGVLSGTHSISPAYQVSTLVALNLLEVEDKTAAADWWRQNVPDANDPSQHFLFDTSACVLI